MKKEEQPVGSLADLWTGLAQFLGRERDKSKLRPSWLDQWIDENRTQDEER